MYGTDGDIDSPHLNHMTVKFFPPFDIPAESIFCTNVAYQYNMLWFGSLDWVMGTLRGIGIYSELRIYVAIPNY